MKKFAVLLAALLVLGCLGGCANTRSVDEVKKAGELVMLTNAAFPPFEYVENGEVVGVDVDIARAIADELGVTLRVVNMDFDPIPDYVKTGKGDIGAAGMTINDERQKVVDFSVEYVKSKQYIIVPADSDLTADTLDGLIMGVQQGTTGDVYFASDPDVVEAKEVKRYKNAIEAAEDLKLGRVDCVVIDELPAKKIAAASGGALKCFESNAEEEYYAIAVQKGNDSLMSVINTVLSRLIEEGKIEEFLVKHSEN